jgi:alkylation response protein AidB-like acyl-CoA dehydrogenase
MTVESDPQTSFEIALEGIANSARQFDGDPVWPAADLTALQAAGAMRWAVPEAEGGDELPALELHLKYEQLATASVATALILTQRDAAVGLIDASTTCPHRKQILGQLATNEIWATVGFSHLTTSRQGGPPAVTARRIEGGYLVNGTIPWSTGGHHSEFIVAGAMLDDDRQILFLLRQSQRGVLPDPPMDLVALSCTSTSSIELKQAVIEDQWVLREPSPGVLGGRRNSLTLGQAFIANGLTRSALNLIGKHDSDRARSAAERFETRLCELRGEILSLCQPGREVDATAANARIRGACNDLAVRSTHAAVALYKGNALLKTHPAQRLAREAMFLLVWSCPNPVIDCTLDLLAWH